MRGQLGLARCGWCLALTLRDFTLHIDA